MTAVSKRDDGLDRILFLECGPLRHEVAVADQVAEQGMRRLLVSRISASRPDLVWRGDTAPLAYPRRDDCALRFVSREVAAELLEALAKSDV